MTWRTYTITRMRNQGRAFVPLKVASMYAPIAEYNPDFERRYAEDQVRRLCEMHEWRYRWNDRRQGWNISPQGQQQEANE